MSNKNHRAKAKRRLTRFWVIAIVLLVAAVYFKYALTHVAETAVIVEALIRGLEN